MAVRFAGPLGVAQLLVEVGQGFKDIGLLARVEAVPDGPVMRLDGLAIRCGIGCGGAGQIRKAKPEGGLCSELPNSPVAAVKRVDDDAELGSGLCRVVGDLALGETPVRPTEPKGHLGRHVCGLIVGGENPLKVRERRPQAHSIRLAGLTVLPGRGQIGQLGKSEASTPIGRVSVERPLVVGSSRAKLALLARAVAQEQVEQLAAYRVGPIRLRSAELTRRLREVTYLVEAQAEDEPGNPAGTGQ